MNSRTIHSVLLFGIVLIFFVTGVHVHAQTMDNLEKEKSSAIISQSTKKATNQISTQLPVLSSDVGEQITTKKKQTEPKPTISSTVSITPTKKLTSPTTTPTPTADLSKSPTPEPTSQSISMTNTSGLDPEKLFSMSNEYRKSKGLPEFKKDAKTCSLATSRAPEVAAEVASGNMHKGLKERNLDYWNTENIISMRTEESAFNWWINDKIHHDAIVGNFTYSCVACSGNSCAQEFTNYQPK